MAKPIFIIEIPENFTMETQDRLISHLQKHVKPALEPDYHLLVSTTNKLDIEYRLFSVDGLTPNEYGEIKEQINKIEELWKNEKKEN